jgi:hypothetical protein
VKPPMASSEIEGGEINTIIKRIRDASVSDIETNKDVWIDVLNEILEVLLV